MKRYEVGDTVTDWSGLLEGEIIAVHEQDGKVTGYDIRHLFDHRNVEPKAVFPITEKAKDE